MSMNRADRAAVVLLRIVGLTGLCALGAVVMPYAWMNAVHQWLGLGELPDQTIVGYLSRSLSAFYAVFGLVLLFAAADLERYRPLARFLAQLLILLGAVFLVVDAVEGMPWWWTASEGPFRLTSGLLILWLTGTATPGRPRP